MAVVEPMAKNFGGCFANLLCRFFVERGEFCFAETRIGDRRFWLSVLGSQRRWIVSLTEQIGEHGFVGISG